MPRNRINARSDTPCRSLPRLMMMNERTKKYHVLSSATSVLENTSRRLFSSVQTLGKHDEEQQRFSSHPHTHQRSQFVFSGDFSSFFSTGVNRNICLVQLVETSDGAKRLYDDLMRRYDQRVR